MSSLIAFFFFTATATTEIYTLSLHDALPISPRRKRRRGRLVSSRSRSRCTRRFSRLSGLVHGISPRGALAANNGEDRKSTRLNSSHSQISYAVFCLKKKKKICSET